MYTLVGGFYQSLTPNERGHYPIPLLGVELGLWEGSYQNQTQLWLRWWDEQGNLLLTGTEQAVVERERALRAQRERDEQTRTLQNAIPQLLAMGLNSQQVAQALSLTVEQVQHHSQ